MLKSFLKIQLVLLIALLSTTANSALFGFGGMSWKEEVLLHDGSKIIVERTADRRGPHEIGQPPPIGDQSISFAMPGTGQIVKWKDKFGKDVGGANFNLMALDVAHGVAYLVVTPAGCLSYNKWGRPNPPYVIFKYEKSEWLRIPLDELPAEIKSPNMLNSSPDEVAEKNEINGVVSAEIIKSKNENFGPPAYKTILKRPLSKEQINNMCEERVFYKGYWILPYDHVAKEIIDQRVNK